MMISLIFFDSDSYTGIFAVTLLALFIASCSQLSTDPTP
jgi:hypothetical protein